MSQFSLYMNMVAGAYFQGYAVGVFLLLLCILFFPAKREQWKGLLRTANLFLAIVCLLLLVAMITSAVVVRAEAIRLAELGAPDLNAYAFQNRITGPYAWAFWVMFLTPFAAQLYWARPLRSSIVITACFLPLVALMGLLFDSPLWLSLLLFPACLLFALDDLRRIVK